MTRFDAVLVIGLAALTACGIPAARALGGEASGEALVRGPAGQTRVSLTQDAQLEIEGRTGTVTFEVADGHLRCLASTCPDQVCVRSGYLSASRPIICAPNGVVATSIQADEADFDAVSH